MDKAGQPEVISRGAELSLDRQLRQLDFVAGTFAPAAPASRKPLLLRGSEAGETSRHRPRAKNHRRDRGKYLLAVVLAVQTCLALRLVWSNTAYMDEALYLWAGHLEWASWLHGVPIPAAIEPFPTYFSGAPALYPPLGALADSIGGLAGARLLSLGFMLIATVLLYATASKLFERTAAIAGAAVFALLGNTLFLSAFATYDAMALFLVALSSWLVVRARGRASEAFLVTAGIVLALANATKYAAALWDPVVIALVVLTAGRGRWLRLAFRAARFTAYLAVPLIVALFRFGGEPYIRGIMFTTLERQEGSGTASPALVLTDSLSWLWLVLALAITAVVISFGASRRIRVLCCVLTLAVLLAPLHQAQIHTAVSLQKHVDFGAWFGAMAAGYALARAAELCRSKGWRIVAAVAAAITFNGVAQANAMYAAGWPNMAKAVADMRKIMPAGHCPCLVTANSVVAYYLMQQIPVAESGTFVSAFYYGYWDPGRQKEITGTPAYVHAIRVHYFSVLEIDPTETPSLYKPVVTTLAATAGYRRIDSIPIQGESRTPIEIWKYQPNKGGDGDRNGHIG